MVVFLVITVSHPTFCCVGVGVVVEVELGCNNKNARCIVISSFSILEKLCQYIVEHVGA